MYKLKEAGKLNHSMHQVYKNMFPSASVRNSFERFQKAEKMLKPYTKKSMSEVQVRTLIHSMGVNTYHRPVGIPENFLVKITKDRAGKRVLSNAPEAHIPLEEFIYRSDINGN